MESASAGAVASEQIIERIDGDTVTIAMPISLRGESLGAIELDFTYLITAYNDNMRQLAEIGTGGAALPSLPTNARLFGSRSAWRGT